MDISATEITPGSLPVCAVCTHRACELLHFGGALAGEFVLIHEGTTLGAECPYMAQTLEEVDALLCAAGPQKLNDRLDDLQGQLTPSERTGFDQRQFICAFNDHAGRIAYVKTLWDNGILSVFRIPDNNIGYHF